MSTVPIADYALLSDCHSAALVDRWGSVDWWCLPRFDGPSVFGRLLDQDAGHFSLSVQGAHSSERRYLDSSLVLATTLIADDGELVLTDALGMAPGVRGHDLGKGSPCMLVRQALCTRGEVTVEIEFRPRFEYGLTVPAFERIEGGIRARGGPTALLLSTTTALDIDTEGVTGTCWLREGETVGLAAQYASSWEEVPHPVDTSGIETTLRDTADAWRSWSESHARYTGPYAEAVAVSGRVLQGLTFVPTGAVVAAPTTSLPESVGGSRNWDYRYSWVRDASFTLDALWVAACPDEGNEYFNFLATAASSVHHRDQIQIMFGIRGERDLSERELPWLRGWADSAPVRVGNAAWDQRQNDVYGELLAAAHRLAEYVFPAKEPLRRLLVTLVQLAVAAWPEPDHGIWEMRDEPRHHLYSKLMCWVALDRGVAMADELGVADRVDAWKEVRSKIRDAILSDGWNQDVGAFTQSFGSDSLDASALVIPIVGFLPADDPRVLSTIEAIQSNLMDGDGLVRRYTTSDGLEGEEGAFLLCSFWLAHALALAGRVTEGRDVFERAAEFANDVGLLAEEVDPDTGQLLGNFPQAFSHIGLINAAWAISEAERGRLL